MMTTKEYLMKTIQKPTVGDPHGDPEATPASPLVQASMSRLLDALYAAQEAGLNPQRVFMLADFQTRTTFNHSRWSYV